jgi:hypothetical protein
LRVKPEFSRAVGFAEVYECKVLEVLEGGLAEASVEVTVLPEDRELGALMARQDEVELTLARQNEDEPRGLAPISGFVDDNRTSWRITDAREATG